MEFPWMGYWKKRKRNFKGLNKNKVVIEKVKFPGVSALGLKIPKECNNKIFWSFQEWKKTKFPHPPLNPAVCFFPEWPIVKCLKAAN